MNTIQKIVTAKLGEHMIKNIVKKSITRGSHLTIEAVEEIRPYDSLPGPFQWPVLGCLPSLLARPDFNRERLHLLADSLVDEYGDIFRIKVPSQPPIVIIKHPDDIEQVYRACSDQPHREFFVSYKRLRSQHPFVGRGQTGIFTENGEEWARVRRRLQPHTSRVKSVSSYLHQMDTVSRDFIDKWEKCRDENNEMPEDFLRELFKWALESLGLVTFNKRLGCLHEPPEALKVISLADDLIRSIHDLEIRSIFRWWLWVDTPGFRKMRFLHDEMLSYVHEAVKESQRALCRRGPPHPEDDLNLLEKLLLDPQLSYEDVHLLLIDLLFAGIDTTSISAAFTIMRLAENPQIQTRLQEELDRVLGGDEVFLTANHLKELRYTKACIKEALRMDPPVTCIVRTVPKDLVLRGYFVPKGTLVQSYIRGSGLCEDNFPSAKHYLPERWLREGREVHHGTRCANHPYASLPFGTGVRNCVGRRFAEQELCVLLARMFRKYRVEWKYDPLNPKLKFLLTPDKPLKFTLKERR